MKNTKKLVVSAMFLAIGLVLPFLTGQIPEIGRALCPMHIPVLLCGFLCGWQYGLLVGFITPLLRSVLFHMPVMMPTAVGMAFELATYGCVAGIVYGILRRVHVAAPVQVYVTLVIAMLCGRVVWGLVSLALYGIQGNAFTWQMFIGGALLNAIPGIIVQIILIPAIVLALQKAGIFRGMEQ